MKHEEEEWIIYVLFVNDIIHASTSDRLCDQFFSEYQNYFDINIKHVMKRDLSFHRDTYIQEALAEYKATITKFLRQK